jgi:hypothetical protein
LECGGLPSLSRAQQAAPLRDLATARRAERALRKSQKGRAFGVHGTSPALRKTAVEPRCRAEGRGATLKPSRASAKLTAAMTLVEPGRRVRGRSEQRPYGRLLRQYVWVKKAGASSRTPQGFGVAKFCERRWREFGRAGPDAGAALRETRAIQP